MSGSQPNGTCAEPATGRTGDREREDGRRSGTNDQGGHRRGVPGRPPGQLRRCGRGVPLVGLAVPHDGGRSGAAVGQAARGCRRHGGAGAHPQHLGAPRRLAAGPGRQGGDGAPEQSADLRDYYNKHTKTDRLDSRILARLPLLHPDGLRSIDLLGPAEPLLRAVRMRSSLVKRRTATAQRPDCVVELLGPGWSDVLGTGDYNKSSLAVLERYADPRALKKLGRKCCRRCSSGPAGERGGNPRPTSCWPGPRDSIELWAAGGLDCEELAGDIATEVRLLRHVNEEIAAMEDRIEAMYEEVDTKGIVVSTPGIGVTLSAGILGRLGDPNRFANLAGVRSFTGIVPKIDQSGLARRISPVSPAARSSLPTTSPAPARRRRPPQPGRPPSLTGRCGPTAAGTTTTTVTTSTPASTPPSTSTCPRRLRRTRPTTATST
jgi:hypothetical protein